jgi:hypothetical protein
VSYSLHIQNVCNSIYKPLVVRRMLCINSRKDYEGAT